MGSQPTSSTPAPVHPDADTNMKPRSSSTTESAYGYHISSSPPTLSPTNTLSSLNPHQTTSSTSSSGSASKEHHSFPFLFSHSRSRSPRPPPPSEISTPSGSTVNPLKHTQTQPALPRKSSHPPPSTQRRHRSEGSVPIVTNTATTTSDRTSPSATSPSSPSADAVRRDSWIQKKPRNSSGSSPGGYGRHGDEWLFGSISLTQTAREIVARRAKKRGDDSS